MRLKNESKLSGEIPKAMRLKNESKLSGEIKSWKVYTIRIFIDLHSAIQVGLPLSQRVLLYFLQEVDLLVRSNKI